VRIALNHKGLAYEPVFVSLVKDEHRAADYQALNPQALVPALVDGQRVISQSLAIIEYLDETQPGPRLLPTDAPERARVRSLSLLVAAEIHPLNNLRVLKYLRGPLAQPEAAVNDWYRHWVQEGLAAYERELTAQPGLRFSVGDTVSLADVCLVPQIFNAKRFETDLSPYPAVMRVFDACMALEAFQKAQPSAQPDAV
jgi:maleylacetoacetate isomerase/maleylpyruvate isomerase